MTPPEAASWPGPPGRRAGAGRVAIPVFLLLAAQQVVVMMSFGVAVFGLHVGSVALVATAVGCWALALLGLGTMFGATLRSQSELQVAYDIGGVLLSAWRISRGWARSRLL